MLRMVHVLPRKDFGQEMCGKPQRPDGGLDPIASKPTDGPIRTQWIRNPVWSGPTHGRGVAGRYDRLPYQYVPLYAEYPEPFDKKT